MRFSGKGVVLLLPSSFQDAFQIFVAVLCLNFFLQFMNASDVLWKS